MTKRIDTTSPETREAIREHYQTTREAIAKHVAIGNSKLPKSTAILNMGSATDCPSNALGLCPLGRSGLCYAFKAERMYPACKPYRDRQALIWQEFTAEEIVDGILAVNDRKRKANKIKALRLNEAGDFWSQACVDKAERIAMLLSDFGITVYVYTHRRDLNFNDCKHLTVNGSNFMIHNEFRAVNKLSGKNPVCPGDCKVCNLCNSAKNLTIECKIH